MMEFYLLINISLKMYLEFIKRDNGNIPIFGKDSHPTPTPDNDLLKGVIHAVKVIAML